MSEKYVNEGFKVGFFILTNIQVGAGVERVVEEFIINAPKYVNTKLIQTDFLPNKRMDEERYKELQGKCQIFTIKVEWDKYKFLEKKFPTLYYFIIRLLISLFIKRKKKEFTEFIRGLDVIYLTANNFTYIFRNRTIFKVGSQHVDFGELRRNFAWKLKMNLIAHNLMYHNIDGFHLFPFNKDLIDLIKPGYNFLLYPRGIDTRLFYPRNQGEVPKFLFVARLEECKGINFIIEVWNRANVIGELHIVGTGSQSNFVQRISKSKKTLFYHGVLDYRALAELYGSSDIFLAPTSCDTYSIVVLEAYSSGCYLLLGSHLSGVFDEYVDRGDGDYLELSYEKWINGIKESVRNINRIRQNRYSRHLLAAQLFDTQRITNEFYDNLQSLSNKKKRETKRAIERQ